MASGRSSENADRTLSAGGQVKHAPSTGLQAQTRAPAPTGSTETQRAPCRVGSRLQPRRLQTQRQLVPPGPGGTKEGGHSGCREPGPGRWREESPPAAWKPGASGATRVLSRWPAAAWGVEEAPWTPRGGEADHQASPRHSQAHGSCPRPTLAAPRGPPLPPPALGQVWSASAQMRRKVSWAEPGNPLGGLSRAERGGDSPRERQPAWAQGSSLETCQPRTATVPVSPSLPPLPGGIPACLGLVPGEAQRKGPAGGLSRELVTGRCAQVRAGPAGCEPDGHSGRPQDEHPATSCPRRTPPLCLQQTQRMLEAVGFRWSPVV